MSWEINIMNKTLFIFILVIKFLLQVSVFAHTDHYKNIKSLEMEIFKNGKYIGFSKFTFKKNEKKFEVENTTKFEVKLMGMKIFSVFSKGLEVYENDQLIFFKSNTMQNDKKKFVELFYDTKTQKYKIKGSSFNGFANKENIIGNWWNHKLLQSESQISPLSGSVKSQTVEFIKKEIINLYGKKLNVEKFKLKSTNQNLSKDKKLDFNIWYDKKRALVVKIEYKRLGTWEYRLKTIN